MVVVVVVLVVAVVVVVVTIVEGGKVDVDVAEGVVVVVSGIVKILASHKTNPNSFWP